jgi:acetoin utilization protein AcuB
MTEQSDSKLTIPEAEIGSRAIELSSGAFERFRNDIAGMLGCDVAGSAKKTATVTLADLKKQFKKLVAVTSVRAEGAIEGSFYFIFGQEAFFTLAGTLAMLPDKVINQNRKQGNLQAATEMGDAVGEIGNLMVGSWDRAFREEFAGHGHFVLSKNFVGSPWNNPEETIELTTVSQLHTVSFEIIVKEFAPAMCAVVYPKDIFEAKPVKSESEAANKDNADAQEQLSDTSKEAAGKEPEANSEKEPARASGESAPDIAAVDKQPPETTREDILPESKEVSESIRKITSSPAILPGELRQALSIKSVQDIMRKDFVWADPDQTVEHALALMQQNNIGYVLVGQNGSLEGIVAKSDVRGAMSPYLQEMYAQWRRPLDIATLQIRLKWVMSKPVYTIHPDASLASLIQQICQQKIKMLPVVDEKGSVMGIVTVFEIFGALSTLL